MAEVNGSPENLMQRPAELVIESVVRRRVESSGQVEAPAALHSLFEKSRLTHQSIWWTF